MSECKKAEDGQHYWINGDDDLIKCEHCSQMTSANHLQQLLYDSEYEIGIRDKQLAEAKVCECNVEFEDNFGGAVLKLLREMEANNCFHCGGRIEAEDE